MTTTLPIAADYESTADSPRGSDMLHMRAVAQAYLDDAEKLLDGRETRDLKASEKRTFDDHMAEAEAFRKLIERGVDAQAKHSASIARFSHVKSPEDDRASSGDAEIDAGHRSIDTNFRTGAIPDYAAERASALLDQGQRTERSLAARWAITAGATEYRGAFAKLLADPTRGHMLWTPEEADAYRSVAGVQSEMNSRASMSLTDANGGYMIPLSLDPAIMLTNDGSINPLRQLATVKQTMTDAWQGVTSAGVTSEWKTEGGEAADASPTVGAPSIPVHLGDAYVSYSFEIGDDAVDFLQELTMVLGDSAAQLQATAYTTGTGSGQPQGIVTGLAGTASEINGAGTEAIVAADAYTLQNALPARFSGNATWQSHIATANTFRQFETTNGAHAFPELRENNGSLLGKPWFENSNMDGAIDAAATENNYALLYGDVAKGFFIVDRVGSTLELIPNVMGANNRPTGQRGALLWFRTGSQVVVPQALRLLDVPTAA
jgi:HK97 family phage major capsid protein